MTVTGPEHSEDWTSAYLIPETDGSWWTVGWDPALGTFFAQQVQRSPTGAEHVLQDAGRFAREIPTLERLAEVVGHKLPAATVKALEVDATELRPKDPTKQLPWEFRYGSELAQAVNGDQPGWATALALVAQRYRDRTITPLQSLPASEVAGAFRWLHQGAVSPGPDAATYITRLGLDDGLARGILDGTIAELDSDQIAQVCDALHCSPFDLWGSELARAALDIYPPERWPTRVEPLDELRNPPTTLPEAKDLLRDFAANQALDRLRDPTTLATTPRDGEWQASRPFLVTGYRRIAILEALPHGQVTWLFSGDAPASADAEHHFAFQQVGDPRPIEELPATEEPFHAVAGWDVPPRLAAAAEALWFHSGYTDSAEQGNIELVRFTPCGGDETWLMWDPTTTTWELVRDPRHLYPGEPSDVLDTAGYTDPRARDDLPIDPPGLDL